MTAPRLPPGPVRDLCSALEDARCRSGLTQGQLAARAGVAVNTVHRAIHQGRVTLRTWVVLWTVLRREISDPAKPPYVGDAAPPPSATLDTVRDNQDDPAGAR